MDAYLYYVQLNIHNEIFIVQLNYSRMLKKLQVKFYIIYKICTDEVLYGNGNATIFYHFLLDLFMF